MISQNNVPNKADDSFGGICRKCIEFLSFIYKDASKYEIDQIISNYQSSQILPCKFQVS